MKIVRRNIKVNAETVHKAVETAKEMNLSAMTGTGITKISDIRDKEVREVLEILQKRCSSSRIWDINKMLKILVEEMDFIQEVDKSGILSPVSQMPVEARLTGAQYLMAKTFGFIPETTMLSMLGSIGIYAEKLSAGRTSSARNTFETDDDNAVEIVSKELGVSKEEVEHTLFRAMRYHDKRKGQPTVSLMNACENINKAFKGCAKLIAEPVKEDFYREGIVSSLKGNKRPDALLIWTDKKGVKHFIEMEYFGWNGDTYISESVSKACEAAVEMEHLYKVFSPDKAKNALDASEYAKSQFAKFGFSKSNSDLENAANRWVYCNDTFAGSTAEDGIYDMLYAALNEAGLAKKYMPKTKVETFKAA